MKKKILLLIGCIAILLSACSKEEKQENIAQKGKSDEIQTESSNQEAEGENDGENIIPESYTLENENIIFSTKIHIAQEAREEGIKEASAVLQQIDTDKVYQQLFQGIEVVEEDTSELEYNDGSNVTQYYYAGKNGESLIVSSRGVQYGTEFFQYVYNCVDTSEGGNISSYIQDMNFSFASQEEALQNISTELEKMGIELGETECRVYALDYQSLQKNEYAMDMDGNEDTSIYKDNWSEEDNCYYFFIRQKIGNLPEYHPYSDLFKNPIEENAPIKVLYSQNGIESLEIERLYDFAEEQGKTISLMPFEEVTEAVTYKYNQLLTGAKYYVTDATLYYMAENGGDGNYQMFPVWIFNVEETVESNGEATSSSLLVFVNACTGEEIAMEDKY